MKFFRFAKFWSEQRGSSAAEFAMIVPVFFALTIGVVNVCLMLYFNSTLHFAVDAAARCGSINPASGPVVAGTSYKCDSAGDTQAYAGALFNYSSLSPNFTATPSASCGYQVVGTATYTLNAVVVSKSVSLSAKSCFPSQS